MKRIYLSGPMSNMLDLNFPLFQSTAATLRAAEHSVNQPRRAQPRPRHLERMHALRHDGPDGMLRPSHPTKLGASK